MRPSYLAALLGLLLALPTPGAPHHRAIAAAGSSCAAPSRYYPTTEGAGATVPEVQGTAPGGELWALLASPPPQPMDTVLKTIIYMTGTGPLQLSATDPEGRVVSPAWGPDGGGPSGNEPPSHPGNEWGSGWIFTSPGCWRLHAQRTDLSGDIWLDVAAPSLRIAGFALRQGGQSRTIIRLGVPAVFVIRTERRNAPMELPDVRLIIRRQGQIYRAYSLLATTSTLTSAQFRQPVRLSVRTLTAFSATVRLRLDKAATSKSLQFWVSR